MTRYQQPSNPYATSSAPANGNGLIGDIRERLAVLETDAKATSRRLDSVEPTVTRLGERLLRQEDQLANLTKAGQAAIDSLPGLMAMHTEPLERRVKKLETPWWGPLRDHVWKFYLGIGMLGFAFGWKQVTGEPLPLGRLLVELFKG